MGLQLLEDGIYRYYDYVKKIIFWLNFILHADVLKAFQLDYDWDNMILVNHIWYIYYIDLKEMEKSCFGSTQPNVYKKPHFSQLKTEMTCVD